MISEVAISFVCSLVFFAIVCESAPACENLPTAEQKFDVHQLNRMYKKFITSPPPCKVFIPTRDLIKENIPTIKPEGLVLYRCPENLLPVLDRTCRSKKTVDVTLEVGIRRSREAPLEPYKISTTQDISCSCK